MITGSCQCGATRYRVDGPLSDASFCHCGICRRLTGSAFGAWAAAMASDFAWTGGEGMVTAWEQSIDVVRRFCGRCGSLLTTTHAAEPESIFVSLGTLGAEGAATVRPEYHQYVDSAAPWHRIGDDLPRHGGWPPHHVGEIG